MSNKILASCIAATLGTLGTAPGAHAQDSAIEEVYVTGSRIKSTSPLGFTPRDVEVEAEVWVRFSIEPAKAGQQ